MMTRRNLKAFVCLTSLTAGLALAEVADAVNFIGADTLGGGPGYQRTKWSATTNWQGGLLPGTSDAVVFSANPNVWSGVGLDNGNVKVASVEYGFNGDWNIDPVAGATLTLNNGNLTKDTTGNQGFSCGIILGADAVWTNLAGINYSGGLSMNGPVSGSVAMTMNGARSGQHSIFSLNSTLSVNSLTIGPYAMLAWTGGADRLPDTMPVTLNGGKLQYTAQSNVNSTEAFGATAFTGDVALQLSKNGTGTATLAPTSLNRVNGGTVIFRPNGQVLGTDVFVKVAAGNGPTVTNGMVAPYFLTQAAWADEHSVGTDTNFVTYDVTNGFTPVTYSGATDINTAGGTAIFLATLAGNRVVTANRALHALKIGIDATNNIDITQTGGPWTLSIGSGGIISRAGDEDVYPGIDFGSAPGVVYESGPSYMSITLQGLVAGSGGLTTLGDGNVTLNSSANTFTGLVTVNNGQLSIGGSGSGNGVGLNRAGTVLPLRVCEMATFNMNGHSQTAGGLDGEGNVSGAGTTLTIIRDNSVTSDFSGVIAGAGMNLVKQGNGTQILSGINTYTGTTTVSDGKLLVNGSLNAGSAVTVNGGTLGGTGVIGGLVTVNSGAFMAPGASPGKLTVGSYSQLSGATLLIELAGLTQGITYDWLNVTGTANLAGALSVDAIGPWFLDYGQTFTVLTAGSIGTNSLVLGGPDATWFNMNTVGNSIVLTSLIPEPATLSLLAFGALALLKRPRKP